MSLPSGSCNRGGRLRGGDGPFARGWVCAGGAVGMGTRGVELDARARLGSNGAVDGGGGSDGGSDGCSEAINTEPSVTCDGERECISPPDRSRAAIVVCAAATAAAAVGAPVGRGSTGADCVPVNKGSSLPPRLRPCVVVATAFAPELDSSEPGSDMAGAPCASPAGVARGGGSCEAMFTAIDTEGDGAVARSSIRSPVKMAMRLPAPPAGCVMPARKALCGFASPPTPRLTEGAVAVGSSPHPMDSSTGGVAPAGCTGTARRHAPAPLPLPLKLLARRTSGGGANADLTAAAGAAAAACSVAGPSLAPTGALLLVAPSSSGSGGGCAGAATVGCRAGVGGALEVDEFAAEKAPCRAAPADVRVEGDGGGVATGGAAADAPRSTGEGSGVPMRSPAGTLTQGTGRAGPSVASGGPGANGSAIAEGAGCCVATNSGGVAATAAVMLIAGGRGSGVPSGGGRVAPAAGVTMMGTRPPLPRSSERRPLDARSSSTPPPLLPACGPSGSSDTG